MPGSWQKGEEGHQFLRQPNTGKILPGSSSGPIKISSLVLSWKELSTGTVLFKKFSQQNPPTPIQKWLRGLNWDKIALALNVILAVSNACAIWSWVNYVFSLCLSFVICKMWVRVGLSYRFPMRIKWDNAWSSVQSLSHVWLFATPWIAARQASLSIANSQSSLKLMSIMLVIRSIHLTLCRPLLLLPSIFPSIRVFSNESVLHIRWTKCWSFSFSISPSNE